MFYIRSKLFLEIENRKYLHDLVLSKMLPPVALNDLINESGKIVPREHKNVTVFFSDIEGFTSIASKCSPSEIMSMLNAIYSIMDYISSTYFPLLYKVETIGLVFPYILLIYSLF